MSFKEITLSNGDTVKVYPVPHFLLMAAMDAVSLPEPPMLKIQTAAGHDEPWPDTSPESEAYQHYLRDKKEAERKRSLIDQHTTLLAGLREVKPPADDEWYEIADYHKLPHHDGPMGRKLDYLLYAYLTGADVNAVIQAVTEISYPQEDRINAKMRSFPNNGGHGTADAGGAKTEVERGAA